MHEKEVVMDSSDLSVLILINFFHIFVFIRITDLKKKGNERERAPERDMTK